MQMIIQQSLFVQSNNLYHLPMAISQSRMTHLQNKNNLQLMSKNKIEPRIQRNKKYALVDLPEQQVYYSDDENGNKAIKNTQADKSNQETHDQMNYIPKTSTKVEQTNFTADIKDKKALKAIEKAKRILKKSKIGDQPTQQKVEKSRLKKTKPNEQIYLENAKSHGTQNPAVLLDNLTLQQNELKNAERYEKLIDKKFAMQAQKRGIIQLRFDKQDLKDYFKIIQEYQKFFQEQTSLDYQTFAKKLEIEKAKFISEKIRLLKQQQIKSKQSLIQNLISRKKKEEQWIKKEMDRRLRIQQFLKQGQKKDTQLASSSAISAPTQKNNQNFNIFKLFHDNSSANNVNQDENLNGSQKSVNPYLKEVNAQTESQKKERQLKKREKFKFDALQKPKDSQKVLSLSIQSSNAQNNEIQLSSVTHRKKILANIQKVNKKCEEQQNIYRIQSQKLQRERQERQKNKTPKKETTVSVNSISQTSMRAELIEDHDSQRRKLQMRQCQWNSSYAKGGPKIKRLEILNRYHYNPFQENQGEDQCELWKKLMYMEIENLKSDIPGIKNEQNGSNNIMDSLLRQAVNLDQIRFAQLGKVKTEDFVVKSKYNYNGNGTQASKESQKFLFSTPADVAKTFNENQRKQKLQKKVKQIVQQPSTNSFSKPIKYQQNKHNALDRLKRQYRTDNIFKDDQQQHGYYYQDEPRCDDLKEPQKPPEKEADIIPQQPKYAQENQGYKKIQDGTFTYGDLPDLCEVQQIGQQNQQIECIKQQIVNNDDSQDYHQKVKKEQQLQDYF